MKKFYVLLFFTLIATFKLNTSYAQVNTAAAVEYLGEMSELLNQSKDEIWQYLKAITNGKNARKVDAKRQNLLAELKNTKLALKKVKPYQGDTLKAAMINYLDLSYAVLKEDYDKILDMEDIAEQSYDLMEAYLLAKEKASEKLKDSHDKMLEAQFTFAKNNNINLIEGEQDRKSEKIERASKTLKYYNEVYLIFFKAYKQEQYVLDAMQKNDINGLEQNAATLATLSNESIEKLKTIQGFYGDEGLKVATGKILLFYKNESEKDFPAMTDFYLKKEKVDKLHKALEAKGKKDTTQEDIDKFNKAVDEYNTALQLVNKINATANSTRSQYLNDWNKSVEKFFAAHN